MLNCCIERKRSRDEVRKGGAGTETGRERRVSGCENGRLGSAEGAEASFGKSWDSWSDSEEEFFECLSDTEELKEAPPDAGKGGAKPKPEGRLHPHGKLTLFNSSEPLYVPITQVRGPLT